MKFLLLCFMLAGCTPALAQIPTYGATKPLTLLSAVTTTGAGTAYMPFTLDKSFIACGTTSAGVGAATVKVEVSDLDAPLSTEWIVLGTITLTLGTARTCDGFASAARWKWWRGNVTAISGTTGTATLTMGY